MYSRFLVPASRWCLPALPVFGYAHVALGDAPAPNDALPVIVDYGAPAECPSAASFRRELVNRLSKPLLTPAPGARGTGSERLVTVHVRIVKTAQRTYVAELTTKTSSGASSPRNLEGPECAALTEALAFTAALALEPDAHRSASDPAAETTGVNSPVEALERDVDNGEAQQGGPGDTQARDGVALDRPNAASKEEGSRPPVATADPPGAASDSSEYVWDLPPANSPPAFWHSALGAGVSVASPLTTGFDTGLYAEFSMVRLTRDSSVWTWSPALALSVHVLRSPWTGSGSTASFYQTSVQASACPNRAKDGAFAWTLCATGRYGVLFAYGEGLTNPRRTQVSVASVGATLGLDYELSHYLTLSGHAGALFELSQHTFEVGLDGRPIAESLPISPWLGIGVSTPL